MMALKKTILLVDDEDMVRDLTAEVLEKNGYHVLTAGSAEEALTLSDRHQPAIDLLLTDVVMPSRSGPALAEIITKRRPGIRVLYMSGYTQTMVVQDWITTASAAVITKPFTAAALLEKIGQVLAAGKARGQGI